MRSSLLVQFFFYICLLSILVLTFLSYRDIRYTQQILIEERRVQLETLLQGTKDEKNLKYILIWTNPTHLPFAYLGQGRHGFIERQCPYTNCFVTSDRKHLGSDTTKFDVIAFHGPEIVSYSLPYLPSKRSPHQKFVFGSIESSDNYPQCNNQLDGFLNWTWTYRLDSDARWGYIVVRDSEKKVIGPNPIMNWLELQDMDPVSQEVKDILKSKSKAAAWLVSNCNARSHRELFVKRLQAELNKFSLSVDIYGNCGKFNCANHEECVKKIKEDYYFYFSFENSFSEDYVTEKLLHAVQNYAVPVVFGGANYTRFLPYDSYLNALELGVEKLASKMNDLINNPEQYHEYFRWRNHYSYHGRDESVDTNDYCRFCAILNDDELMKKTTVHDKFKEWWTPPRRC